MLFLLGGSGPEPGFVAYPRSSALFDGWFWLARCGGAAAVSLLVDVLPPQCLAACTPAIVRAMLAVMKWLPAHAVALRNRVHTTLLRLVNRCFCPETVRARKILATA